MCSHHLYHVTHHVTAAERKRQTTRKDAAQTMRNDKDNESTTDHAIEEWSVADMLSYVRCVSWQTRYWSSLRGVLIQLRHQRHCMVPTFVVLCIQTVSTAPMSTTSTSQMCDATVSQVLHSHDINTNKSNAGYTSHMVLQCFITYGLYSRFTVFNYDIKRYINFNA